MRPWGLRTAGHDVVAASRRTGVDVVTGHGLAGALTDAAVAVDVTEAPAFDSSTAVRFFTAASRSLLAAEADAGVRHHRPLGGGGGPQPRRLLPGESRAGAAGPRRRYPAHDRPRNAVLGLILKLLHARSHGQAVHVPPVAIQPISPVDVAEALAVVAAGPPRNGILELAGDEAIGLDEFVRLILAAEEDPRRIVADAQARFFGARLDDGSLVPGPGAEVGESTLRDWLRHFMSAD